jgi:hypothetical protein
MNPNQITYVDGFRLQRSFLAGAQNLIEQHVELDNINVFPVPDGDTGTNMAATMRFISETLLFSEHVSVYSVSQSIADAALNGARGNSGAILAQFFIGFSKNLPNKNRIRFKSFARAVKAAAELAYSALSQPKEGTILTVIKDWAHALDKIKTNDYILGLQTGLDRAKKSLTATTQMLEELKKANVVDAGAKGFILLLEGILDYIRNGEIRKPVFEKDSSYRIDNAEVLHEHFGEITYQYCCEFLIEGAQINSAKLKDELLAFGDSIVVAANDSKAKIHLHSNEAHRVFQHISNYGDVIGEKIDNMRQQAYDASVGKLKKTAIIVDSASDIPADIAEKYNIHIIPVRVYFGKTQYIDRLTIQPDQFYTELVKNPHHPKTSQPSPLDFERCYKLVSNYFESAISIHVPARHSGTLQAAKRSATAASKGIHVFDSNSVSIGIALLAIEAAKMVDLDYSPEKIMDELTKMRENLSTFLSVRDVSYLIKGGRLSKAKGSLIHLLNLKPILTISPECEIVKLSAGFGTQASRNSMIKFALKKATNLKNIRVGILHANDEAGANYIESELKKNIDMTLCIKNSISPALGVHGGPGLTGICILGDPK